MKANNGLVRRRFNKAERVALYVATGGMCSVCRAELSGGWEADHVVPHSAGGPTDTANAQALCRTCNRRKGANVKWTQHS